MLASFAMKPLLYSIRMRASREGAHVSGAERIVPRDRLDAVAAVLTRRALEHAKGDADDISLHIEVLDPATIVHLSLPEVTTVQVASVEAGRSAALAELLRAGVSEAAARSAIATLADGVTLRGAMLVDAQRGSRFDPDPQRGVRASRMDLTPAAEEELHALLTPVALDNEHVREALVLAAKVSRMPGFVAELCWSDDPDYSAGYVCTQRRGYVRFPHLKPLGDHRGGRVFFVDARGFDPLAACAWLEKTPVLCDRVGILHPTETWNG